MHCVDARTGQPYWVHDAGGEIWASTLVADGKVYIGTRRGDFWVLAAGKEKRVLSSIRLDDRRHQHRRRRQRHALRRHHDPAVRPATGRPQPARDSAVSLCRLHAGGAPLACATGCLNHARRKVKDRRHEAGGIGSGVGIADARRKVKDRRHEAGGIGDSAWGR